LLNKAILQIIATFLTFYVSQGSVATRMRCGGFFNDHFITRLLLSYYEGEHVAKLRAKVGCSVLFNSRGSYNWPRHFVIN